ncbi:MAG: hypothetical protein CSA65_04910 [Proteobacteria bacterium]|nr:MAG: hypothetical protein CSB49_05580 [Pseudomonadota bacterium]PIE18457.1 MAG: hypothetical protein CSA65_04910 [Pseudomonadota bacterium]
MVLVEDRRRRALVELRDGVQCADSVGGSLIGSREIDLTEVHGAIRPTTRLVAAAEGEAERQGEGDGDVRESRELR